MDIEKCTLLCQKEDKAWAPESWRGQLILRRQNKSLTDEMPPFNSEKNRITYTCKTSSTFIIGILELRKKKRNSS